MTSGRKIVRKRTAQDAQNIFGALQNEDSRKKIRGTENQFENLALDEPGEGSSVLTLAEAVTKLAEYEAVPEPDDVEMTGMGEAHDPAGRIDKSTLAITDPGQLEFRKIPKALSAQCVVRRNQAPEDFGALFGRPTSSVWNFRLVLDLGRYGRPSIMLRARRSKDLKQQLDESKPANYLEAKFEWQPGVPAGTLEAGQIYRGQKLSDPKKVYQIDQIGCNPLNDDTQEELMEAGYYKRAVGSQITTLSVADCARLVHINFVGKSARIETQIKSTEQMLAGTSPGDKAFMNSLFSEEEVTLSVTFLVPPDPEQKRGPHWIVAKNSEQMIHKEWPWFEDAVMRRLPPLHPYVDLDAVPRTLKVSMNMDSIQFFSNRIHVIYGKEKQKAIHEQTKGNGTVARWPLADKFYAYPKQTYFSTDIEFMTHVQGAVCREQQWIEGEYMGFSREGIKFAIVRTYQSPQLKVEVTQQENLRQRSYFLFGYLPKDKKLQLPAADSEWQIEFDQKLFGQDVHQETHRRWVGYVKSMTDEERKITGATFVLVAIRPKKGQKVASANSVHDIKSHHHRIGRMVQVIDRKAPDRLLRACKDFCTPSRTDLDRFRIPLIYSREIKTVNPVDLTEGGNPLEKVENMGDFQQLVDLVQDDLNDDQKNLFNRELRLVHNGLKIVRGGPGCVKTYTMALVVCFLTLINHKVLIVAEDNGSINKFMKTLEDVRFKLSAKALDDPTSDNLKWLDVLSQEVFYRFVPPVQEKDALLDNDVDSEGMHQTGQNRELGAWKNNTDALQLVHAQLALQEALAKQAVDNPEMPTTRADLEARLRVYNGDFKRLESEYERMAERCQKVNEFPAIHSIVHHIGLLRKGKETGKIPRIDKRFAKIEEYENASEEYLSGKGPEHKLAERFRLATDELVALVVGTANVVATTHVGSVHDLLKPNFRPTVVIHEEASRVKIPTALCAMSYPNVRAHIFVGDKEQLSPFQASKPVNEFAEMGELSMLQFLHDKGQGFCWLSENYRNHPDILAFPNRKWYSGVLKSNACTKIDTLDHQVFRKVMMERYNTNVASQYYFVNAARGISHVQPGGTSLENWAEAKIAMEICKSLIDGGIKPQRITIDPLYRGQMKVVNDYLLKAGISETPVVSVDQYQGEDNDFTISSLTATAHQRLHAALKGGAEVYQVVSHFIKLFKRLNVAATRAKKGHIFIGSAESLDKALEPDSTGSDLRELIHDAISRGIMLKDSTEDESPYVQDLLASSASAQQAFDAETDRQVNLDWMRDHRENRVEIKKKEPYVKPAPVTYSGPFQVGQFGGFPGPVRDKTIQRQSGPNAVKPHETQDTGEEKPDKPFKGRSRKERAKDPARGGRGGQGGGGRGGGGRGGGGSRGGGSGGVQVT
jgi:uncharacterized membrane protein YgcG